jgi:hypothetical protein
MMAEERAAPPGVMPMDGHHKVKARGRNDTEKRPKHIMLEPLPPLDGRYPRRTAPLPN